jgi:hypothetical protein
MTVPPVKGPFAGEKGETAADDSAKGAGACYNFCEGSSMKRALPACLVAIALIRPSLPVAQSFDKLTDEDMAAAIDLAVSGAPAPYVLYAGPLFAGDSLLARLASKPSEPWGRRPMGAYAYTPFARVALAAHAIFSARGVRPRAEDVAPRGEDPLIYIVVPDRVTDPARPQVVAMKFVADRDSLTHHQETGVGLPATWVKQGNAVPALGFDLPVRRPIVGAFPRATLARGGCIVTYVRGAMQWAWVPQEDAARWR